MKFKVNDVVVIDRDLDSECLADVVRFCTDAFGREIVVLLNNDSCEQEEWLLAEAHRNGRVLVTCRACGDVAHHRIEGEAFCAPCGETEGEALRADRAEAEREDALLAKFDALREGGY